MKLRNWMAVGLATALLVVPVEERYRLMPQSTQLTAAAADNSCGDNLTWSLSGSTLYISGSGKMTDYASYEPSPWYDSRDSIQSVSVSGATTIGAAAFANCTKLTSVNLPNGITSLGAASFSGCTALTGLSLPSTIKTIGKSAFYKCSGLQSLTIPDGVTSIGDFAFYKCTALTSVTIPASVSSIALDSFSNCSKLTIYGYTGSYAETYASNARITFRALGTVDPQQTTTTTTTTTTTSSTTTTSTTTTTTVPQTTAPPIQTTTTTNSAQPELGDINGDGTISVADAILVLQCSARQLVGDWSYLDWQQRQRADIDSNGTIDVNDACKILRYCAMIMAGQDPGGVSNA